MSILETIKGKAGEFAEDAERARKLTAAQVKLKSLQGDLDKAFAVLGREAFDLIEKGELSHTALEAAVTRVRAAKQAVADKEAEIAALRAPGT